MQEYASHAAVASSLGHTITHCGAACSFASSTEARVARRGVEASAGGELAANETSAAVTTRGNGGSWNLWPQKLLLRGVPVPLRRQMLR